MTDPITFERWPVLAMSEAASSDELLDRLIGLVDNLCDDLLGQEGLNSIQIAGLRRAKSRIPGAITAYRGWVSLFGWSDEQTQNALFLLATMADNLLCVGALAMRDPTSAAIVESIISGGKKGGQKAGRKRRTTADAWKAVVEAEIIRIRQDNPALSQDKLADEILFAWKGENPPGHQSITKHISTFDKAQRALGNEGGSRK